MHRIPVLSRLIVVRLAALALAGPGAAAPAVAQGTPMKRPSAPYVTSACPFECCTYGAWRFESAVTLRAAPRPGAAIVARLGAGARVRADSGRVQVDTIGLVVADGGFRDPDGGGEYAAGDTILVLDYLGEGFFHVWVRGERRQLPLVDVLSSFGPPAAAGPRPLRELRPPASTWWAHVTTPARKGRGTRRGWVLMTADTDVRGADACGGPG